MKRVEPFLIVLVLAVTACTAPGALAKKHGHGAEANPPDATTAGKYATVDMRHRKLAVDKAAGVIYLDANQREARRVVIRDGLVYDPSGALVADSKSKHHNLNSYVMDSTGTFYLFDEFTEPTVRHSSIFAGGPVAGAGNIRISDGRIVHIDSDSGHYSSTRVFSNVLTELRARGVNVDALSKE